MWSPSAPEHARARIDPSAAADALCSIDLPRMRQAHHAPPRGRSLHLPARRVLERPNGRLESRDKLPWPFARGDLQGCAKAHLDRGALRQAAPLG